MYCTISSFITGLTIFFFLYQPVVVLGEDTEKLLKMVVLTRHGVRAPVSSRSKLEQLTEKVWPYWSVQDGYLTSRGSVLISKLWGELRNDPLFKELFPQKICPDPDLIYVYANTTQRTQATAIAILNGLAPGCGLTYFVLDSKYKDPLFNAIETGLCPINVPKAFEEFYSQYWSVESIQKEYKEPLEHMVAILGKCPKETCKRYSLPEGSTILDIPSEVIFDKKSKQLVLQGGLRLASLVSEYFLFEQGEWPQGNLSSLGISQEQLKTFYPIHSTVSNMINRIPQIATSRGSALMQAIVDALTSSDKNSQINKAKLIIFSGHEGNVQSVAGMLNLHWKVKDFSKNAVPPGGMLVFTLWETSKGNVVKMYYMCQMLEAIVSSSYNYSQSILKAQLELRPCTSSRSKNKDPGVCSEQEFKEWIAAIVKKHCLPSQFRSLLKRRTL